MKTVLIYVLSAHFAPYGKMMQTSMETWDAHPLEGTRTIYYCGVPVGGDTDRVISFPVDEAYKHMGHKNIAAFRHALTLKWDYMARVNSSCYVHKRRLLEHVQALPDAGVMQGIVSAPTPVCGCKDSFMWGGGQFIFSRDVIQAFVSRAGQWRHDLMEDVAMSELARTAGVDLRSEGRVCSIEKTPTGWSVLVYNGPEPGFEFTDFADLNRLEGQYFYRVKYDPDRSVDAFLMKQMAQALLP